MTPRAPRVAAVVVALLGVSAVVALRAEAPPPPTGPTPPSLAQRSLFLHDEPLEPRFEQLKALHARLPMPAEGDWLAEHDEQGQSVGEYLVSSPTRATPQRRTLYLLPIGEFTPEQDTVVAATTDFLARFFGLPVAVLEAFPTSGIPASGQRRNAQGGQLQLRTTTLMQEVLLPRRPADAMAVLGLTAVDLFPDDDWNFVFGEASLEARVGVWSLYRNGSAQQDGPRFLTRTLKTAAHELGHQFGLRHCLAFACVMNGSNSLEEADRQPMTLCPACLQKLTWNVGLDPVKRAQALASFYAAHEFEAERWVQERTVLRLTAPAASGPQKN